jgi:hypothetical protein
MPARWITLWIVLSFAFATLAYPQGASFGPKPIYLRGGALAWELDFDQPVDEVFDAARKVGKKHRLSVVERDDGSGVIRLARGNQKGAMLDKHCTYPIVNYYSWRPLESFAAAQSTALTRRRPGETLAQAGRLNGTVHLTIRSTGSGAYTVQSICSAFLHEWGLLESTSLGVLEKSFLEDFLEELGTPTEIPLPEVAVLEPSRADPTRDLHLAQQCQEQCTAFYRCSGMYVDPDTRELRCVGDLEESPDSN